MEIQKKSGNRAGPAKNWIARRSLMLTVEKAREETSLAAQIEWDNIEKRRIEWQRTKSQSIERLC